MIRILRLEPSRERARVTTSNDDPVGLVAQSLVLVINEVCSVSQGLVNIQVLKILSGPVSERLRFTIVTVFKCVEECTVLSTDYHWVLLLIRRRAGPLTTDVEECRALSLFTRVELVVKPVALLVGALIFRIEVVKLVSDSVRGVISHGDLMLHFVRV